MQVYDDDYVNFNISSGGSINLNALQSINGVYNNSDAQVNFYLSPATSVNFANLSTANGMGINVDTNAIASIGPVSKFNYSRFNVTGAGGKILFNSDTTIGANSSVNLVAGGIIESRRNFSYVITGAGNFIASTGILQMDGGGVQTLEVAGTDAGAVAPGNSGNFGFGQLQIGTQSAATEVDLVDAIDNGDRGTTPKPESLYLFGLNGQGGLILNDGSFLVIGNLNTYSMENGAWINLQSLFTGSQTIVPFTLDGSNGFIAKNLNLLTATWSNLGDGSWDTAANWSTDVVPLNANDVRITPIAGVTVTGPSANSHIRSLTIDALPAGDPSILNLNSPITLTVTTSVQVNARGQINLQAGTLNAAQLNVTGVFNQSANTTLQIASMTNTGPFTSAGNTTVTGLFTNNGNYFQTAGTATLGQIQGTGNTTIAASATVTSDSIQQSSLTLNGILHIRPQIITAGTTKTNALTLGGSLNNWTAALDLGNNKLIVEATAVTKPTVFATLQNQALYGTTHPTGITTSSLSPHTALAVVDNAVTHFTTFGGLPVDANAILLAPELLGDSNLDGHVDLTDLNTILNHLGQSTPNWTDGNFDNAATIDLTDLNDVLNNLGTTFSSPSLTPAFPTPEPSSLLMLSAFALLLPRRRHARSAARRIDYSSSGI